MESRYKSIKHIGEGAFSSVILALNIETNEKVAIKKMKKRRWKDTAAQAEINALQKLHHENVIRLLDVFREDYRSFLVFECMDCDLNELVVSRNGRRLPDTVVLDITYQVLNGLDFIHKNDFFHRDIKPENVLIRRHITPTGPGGSSAIVVEAKIADFGLVHDMDFSRPLTDYISTRWYRAPEVLLNCANYSTPIDVWAVGTIVSELATLRPLFPGNNQIDQLRRIFEVLGTPRISAPAAGGEDDGADANGSWYEGAVHARKLGITFVPSTRKPLDTVMPEVSSAVIQLVDYMLVLNPSDRPTARDALNLVSRMLDQTIGEPLAGDEDRAQVVPEPMQHEDMDEVPAAVVPAMTKTSTSPTFGPVGRSTPASAANTPMAPAISVSASTKTEDDDIVEKTLNDHTFAAPAAAPGKSNGRLGAAMAAIQDGRISFTPRDKFAQQVINGQIQQHSANGQAQQKASEPPNNQQQQQQQQQQRQSIGAPAEVSIVKALHREPLRDPRGDLSDLAVRSAGSSRGRAGSVLSMSSATSIDSRSFAESSGGSSASVVSRQSATFSVGDLPSPLSASSSSVEPGTATGGLRLYAAAPSVIGDAPMIRALPPSSAAASGGSGSARQSVASSVGDSHIRRAPGIPDATVVASSAGEQTEKRKPGAAAAATVAADNGQGDDGFVHVTRNSPVEASPKPQSAATTTSSSSPVDVPANPPSTPPKGGRLLGLRQKSNMGNPLIRRALSMKKGRPANDAGAVPAPMPTVTAHKLVLERPVAAPDALIKRSKSALNVAESHPASTSVDVAVAAAADTTQLDSPTVVSASLLDGIDIGSIVASAMPSTPREKPRKKDEWIANTQFLRQRLGGDKNDSEPNATARKRRSSVGDARLATTVRDSAMLGARRPIASGLFAPPGAPGSRQSRRSTLTETPDRTTPSRRSSASSRQFAQTLASRRARDADVARAKLASGISWAARLGEYAAVGDDYLGVRVAIDDVMLSTDAQPTVGNQVADDESDVMSGLDSFAPVTFDAGSLFRQSLLTTPVSGGSLASPQLATKGGALSPADYMATFSDARSKLTGAARKQASSPGNHHHHHASGHRFLSKVKSAFTGGGRRRSASSMEKGGAGQRSNDGASARIVDSEPPRLDFDLGASLLTPDSTLHHGAGERGASPKEASAFEPPASASAPYGSVANDSAYYLIDYINGESGTKSGTGADRAPRHPSQPPSSSASAAAAAAAATAARRVVNKSTRSRQTQYEYKFGSQIFECLDKDLVLLKTDVFKDVGSGLSTLDPGSVSSMSEWMRSTSNTIDSVDIKEAAAKPRKRQVNVAKATAYTAVALNRIVANNNKNRSANVPSNPAASTPSQLSRQLMI
ncbi:hypothetical protein LPJ53_001148 [Coemansia erecta]|uniref:Protein kinase domain-containing protein n=1 Tax=Coemansia erecta TaxID=147472 RepID=A0A9W7Y4Y1_9FUNG|nr:hypothetical protein LPJ53_001148 [Coemansia erecta]